MLIEAFEGQDSSWLFLRTCEIFASEFEFCVRQLDSFRFQKKELCAMAPKAVFIHCSTQADGLA